MSFLTGLGSQVSTVQGRFDFWKSNSGSGSRIGVDRIGHRDLHSMAVALLDELGSNAPPKKVCNLLRNAMTLPPADQVDGELGRLLFATRVIASIL